MKYIRFENPSQSFPSFLLFVAPLLHDEVAEMVRSSGLKPISAGYYDPVKRECFGESTTLHLKPGNTDSEILGAMAKATLGMSPARTAYHEIVTP